MDDKVIEKLLNSDDPSVKFKVLVNVLGKNTDINEVKSIQEEIKSSQRVKELLSERKEDGTIPFHPYKKWFGAHWILATLADIGYPSGDESLIPLRDQVYGWLFSSHHEKNIKTIEGKVRRCASQEGNALYATLSLGIADSYADELADRLIRWQWADGGWNCDKNPDASNSSFMESLIPLRALALHAKVTGSEESKITAERAGDIFLKRRLYKRQRDGEIIDNDFVTLHYPCYWHYDILFGLKVMAEAGFINDERCNDALDLLESKRIPDGGFPAEKKYYQTIDKSKPGRRKSGSSLVDWGYTGSKKCNEFVTADALYVLKESGRL
ncbi:MAG: hypothetical protein QG641_1057 [Candidatus Poribacteria bacterium]|nr:hypothetical protein [Candidatus Poribacteria bacterium]